MDEPALKVPFTISLGAESKYTALSNMPGTKTNNPVDGFEDFVWTEFETTPPMSSYLVAFGISEMASVQ